MKVNLHRANEQGSQERDYIRIEPFDTVEMDKTLARLVIPMLRQIRNTTQSAPCSMPALNYVTNSSQKTFSFYADDDGAAYDCADAQWQDCLDKMIFAFMHIEDRSWEKTFDIYEHDHLERPIFTDDNESFEWSQRMTEQGFALENIRLRIQEGLDLFAQHYAALYE